MHTGKDRRATKSAGNPAVRSKRIFLPLIVLAASISCTQPPDKPAADQAYKDSYPLPEDALRVEVSGKHGGRIITAAIGDFTTFNSILSFDAESQTLNQLTTAGLVRLNLKTQQVEPALAKAYESSADHKVWTFHLRKGLRWSDGHPFTAEDVLFTMQIVNDPNIPSGAQDALTFDEKPIQWIQKDAFTVEATLPSATAPFLRQLDGATVPILPKHQWSTIYQQGKFPESMQTSMRPDDFVCLGPFRLKAYKPGQQLTLVRNPHYWKKDQSGKRLPYLDEITFVLVTDLDHLQLSIENGKVDTYYNIRAQDVDALKTKADTLGLKVWNLGPAYECEQFFFNVNGGKNPKTGKPYVAPVKRSWFSNVNFRRGISHAIDRDSLVRLALFGKGIPAYGVESSANKIWYNDRIQKYPYDPKKAMELFLSAGFIQKLDASGKRVLFDSHGNAVRFSMYTNAGNTIRQNQCNLIASDLSKLGIAVDYTPIQFNALVDKVTASFDYDAALLGLTHDDLDPAGSMNILLSNGSLHFWWPLQDVPQTPWEKRIDQLMMQQLATFDFAQRKKLYDEVQEIIAEQQPIIFTVTQYVFVAARTRIGNLQPTVSRHRTLWNADELFWQ